MTLIIAAKGNGHIIVGADSRGVRQDGSDNRIQTDRHRKLIRLNRNNCILIAGNSEKGVYLTQQFLPKVKPNHDIKKILKMFCEFCRNELKDVFRILTPNYYPDIAFILAGYEKDKKGRLTNSRLYIIRSYDIFEEGESLQYVIEGKDLIPKYLFVKNYKEEMTQEENVQLVFDCLYDTEHIDGDVGGNYTIEIITKRGFTSINAAKLKNERISEEENKKFREVVGSN